MSDDVYRKLARLLDTLPNGFPATPDGLEIVSQFRLPPGGTGASWAHPVVCGGRLYLRHADRLFAYEVKSGT